VVVLAIAGCGDGPQYHATRGTRLVHFTLASRLTHHELHEILVVPPPEVLLLDGGADSYWHDRVGGRWGSMVTWEAIPAGIARTHARRVAIGGISMGGYGALLLGSRDRGFCAVGAQSPALWLSPGETAPGAFDDGEDYDRNDVFELQPPHQLWIDLGASDPFRTPTLAYARRAGVPAHVRPGGHDAALWNSFTPQFLRFFAHACA
jgi:S-formylglutathione hydrolase FrmB